MFQWSFALQAALGLAQVAVGDPGPIVAVLRTPVAQMFFDRDLLSVRVAEESLNFIWQGRAYAFGTYLGSSGLGIGLAVAATITWALLLDHGAS